MSVRMYGRFENRSRTFEGIVMKFVPAMWGEREKKRIRAKIARFDKISTR